MTFLDRFWTGFERVWPKIDKIGIILHKCLDVLSELTKPSKTRKKGDQKVVPPKKWSFFESVLAKTGQNRSGIKNWTWKADKSKISKNGKNGKKMSRWLGSKSLFQKRQKWKKRLFSQKNFEREYGFCSELQKWSKTEQKKPWGVPQENGFPVLDGFSKKMWRISKTSGSFDQIKVQKTKKWQFFQNLKKKRALVRMFFEKKVTFFKTAKNDLDVLSWRFLKKTEKNRKKPVFWPLKNALFRGTCELRNWKKSPHNVYQKTGKTRISQKNENEKKCVQKNTPKMAIFGKNGQKPSF